MRDKFAYGTGTGANGEIKGETSANMGIIALRYSNPDINRPGEAMLRPIPKVRPKRINNRSGIIKTRWSDDEKSLASFMHGLGLHYRHIAEAVGRTPGTVRCRISREIIVADTDVEELHFTLGHNRPWTEDEETLVDILLNRGQTPTSVAEMLHRSLDEVEDRLNALGRDVGMSATRISVGVRTCLRCRSNFLSQGPHHRICNACKDSIETF